MLGLTRNWLGRVRRWRHPPTATNGAKMIRIWKIPLGAWTRGVLGLGKVGQTTRSPVLRRGLSLARLPDWSLPLAGSLAYDQVARLVLSRTGGKVILPW